MTEPDTPPGKEDFEITLFGPGYGESVVLHVGGGVWVLIDSCIEADGQPVALRYLEHIGVDPAEAVALVVATHWHDDHIRGMARQIAACGSAAFCCAAALCQQEFLATIRALEGRSTEARSSGVREIYDVLSRFAAKKSQPTYASANRLIFSRNDCEIWSLSPVDAVFKRFLQDVGTLLPKPLRPKARVPPLSPNDASVVLWVRVGGVAVLLGADLERGWADIVESRPRPADTASVFKVPHHGAENADEPDVWNQLLTAPPIAVLTPWHKGSGTLPKRRDVRRILGYTPNAYITARHASLGRARKRSSMVERTLRRAPTKLRRVALSTGQVRLRRSRATDATWSVETLSGACHLEDFATQ